jgi:hypothetical protein
VIAEARVPLLRIRRTRRALLPLVGWTLLALVAAKTTTLGADHVLRGTFGFVVLPLLTYGIVAAALGGVGLRAAVRPLVSLGADPARASAGAVLVACAFSAVTCALVGAVTCVFAHRTGDAPLNADLTSTAGIAALSGAAYAAYFCFGSAIGKGAMRGFFLALDWLAGSGAGFASIFVPRGHVTSLLGGTHALEMSARTSSIFLVFLLVIYAGAAIRLGQRT